MHIVCEAEIDGESFSLTRKDHLLKFSQEALRVKPDLIVIDTLASLCPVFSENDNAEQQRSVWRPLQKLARDCDAAILVLHHVGKRSEDGQTSESVYRGRGASASGGAARAVWLLIPDLTAIGCSTLRCVKAKGDTPQEARLQLDGRWMTAMNIDIPKPVTAVEQVLGIVNREMRKSEIVAALDTVLPKRTVERALAEAIQLRRLRVVKTGHYAPIAPDSANSASLTNTPLAEVAEVAEEDQAETPPTPPTPKGVAELAGNGRLGAQNDSPPLPPHSMELAEVAGNGKQRRKVVRI